MSELRLIRNVDLHECFSMIMHATVYYFNHALSQSVMFYNAKYSHDKAVFYTLQKHQLSVQAEQIQVPSALIMFDYQTQSSTLA